MAEMRLMDRWASGAPLQPSTVKCSCITVMSCAIRHLNGPGIKGPGDPHSWLNQAVLF